MPKEILIVEDDQPTRELLGDLFQTEGFETFSVRNGAHALDLFHSRLERRDYLLRNPRLRKPVRFPDLVVSDYSMPDIDGLTLAKMLREFKRKETSQLPILLITGMSLQDLKNQEPEVNNIVDVVIPKPFDIDNLMDNVTNLISCRRKRVI